jgi:AraC-like DNA-binding protein
VLREAPRELTDARAALAELWCGPARAGVERAARAIDTRSARDPHDVLARVAPSLERAIAARLASHGEAVDLRVRAAATVLASGGSVREASARAGISERQLARRFAARVGVAPKVFARVMRLRRAASALAGGASPLAAASAAGYADQAHFTREAKGLAGATPSALVSEMFKTPPALAS